MNDKVNPLLEVVREFTQRWKNLTRIYCNFIDGLLLSEEDFDLAEAQYQEHRNFFIKSFPKFKDELSRFRLRMKAQPVGNKYILGLLDLEYLQRTSNPFRILYDGATFIEQIAQIEQKLGTGRYSGFHSRSMREILNKKLSETGDLLKEFLGFWESKPVMQSNFQEDKCKVRVTERFVRIIERYGKDYSIAFIYTVFVIISIFAALVLFGILHSTGLLKIAFGETVKEAEFCGAFAGFLATLIILINSYNRVTKGKERITLRGNVLFSNGKPVPNARVFVEGVDRQKLTDQTGWFEIEVNEQCKWMVRASYDNFTGSVCVAQEEANDSIRIVLNVSSQALG